MPAYAFAESFLDLAGHAGLDWTQTAGAGWKRGRRRSPHLHIHIHILGAHMKQVLVRLLVVLMAWTPYQIAQAGMIGTDQVVASASQADRNSVLSFVSRGDVAGQLQSMGLDPATAKDRVAAMTDQEVRYIAGKIDTMPAGALSGSGLLLIII